MKIAVIGPGSMGLLYGFKLAACADVVLIGNNKKNLDEIAAHGVTLKREGEILHRQIPVLQSGAAKAPADLVILFTKAYQTQQALEENRALTGPDTVLLTLQNGAGHEAVLRQFVREDHVLIGTTAQGSSRENAHTIIHSGLGDTVIGAVVPTQIDMEGIRAVFEQAGFPCIISDDIRYTVWNKLMINASSSALSGVLQVRQGIVAEDAHAWEICRDLIREICRTAAAEGCIFDEEEQVRRLAAHLKNAPNGYTSIYADLKNGRKTEAEFITGAVVRASEAHGLQVPVQKTLLHMILAMEGKQ